MIATHSLESNLRINARSASIRVHVCTAFCVVNFIVDFSTKITNVFATQQDFKKKKLATVDS